MRTLQIIGFCAGCLAATAVVTALVFPHTAMSREKRASLDQPQPAGSLGSINLGRVYGKVPVATLLEAHRTVVPSSGGQGSSALPQFGGC